MIVWAALIGALLALGACAHEDADRGDRTELIGVGAEIASARCAGCHATGAEGDSPAPEAPRFRHLSRLYRFEVLEVELREGVHVGDESMPSFIFSVDDTDALIAYLRAIQTD